MEFLSVEWFSKSSLNVQTITSCLSSPQPDAHPVLVEELHTLPHSLATYLSRLPTFCCRPAWHRSVTERLQSIQLRHIEQHPCRAILSVVPSILHKRLVLLQSGSEQLCVTLWTAAFSRRPSGAAAGALF